MAPATLYIWGLGPGSRNLNFSPTPRPNLNFKAVPSSSQRVLQLWSNRTWSIWLLFWSRKWPSEASNHHHFPLRGLGEGCALWVARKSSLTWGAARQKRRFLYPKTDFRSDFHCLRPLRRPYWIACRPLTLRNVQGSWCHGPVREYGLKPPPSLLSQPLPTRPTSCRQEVDMGRYLPPPPYTSHLVSSAQLILPRPGNRPRAGASSLQFSSPAAR